MVAEHLLLKILQIRSCSLAKISMVAEQVGDWCFWDYGCSLAKISMVAERITPVKK